MSRTRKPDTLYFLKQLVEEKQRAVGEILNVSSETIFTNRKLMESAKAHQVMCSDAIAFIKSLEAKQN